VAVGDRITRLRRYQADIVYQEHHWDGLAEPLRLPTHLRIPAELQSIHDDMLTLAADYCRALETQEGAAASIHTRSASYLWALAQLLHVPGLDSAPINGAIQRGLEAERSSKTSSQ
jgi:hypothetical protein